MTGIVWPQPEVEHVLQECGYAFARVRTPWGWRTRAHTFLKPPEKRRLEGNCFVVSLKLALAFPERYHYCEGYAREVPHAWV